MSSVISLLPGAELDIVKTFECGQCFRWNRNAQGVYTGVARGYAARVWEQGGQVYLRSDAPQELWADYFDLSRDYAAAAERFRSGGEYLRQCTEYGRGIRILRQEPWEALCSFIISQCNNIARIKGIVERLCAMYGKPLELDGQCFRSFPDAAALAALTEADLAPLRAGYRSEYIISAARAVTEGQLDLDALTELDSAAARAELLKLRGVGEKVANCVVLFGLRHMEAFPIDVWIRRSLREHFPPDFRPDSLGECAGLAQQYIFYFARSGPNG